MGSMALSASLPTASRTVDGPKRGSTRYGPSSTRYFASVSPKSLDCCLRPNQASARSKSPAIPTFYARLIELALKESVCEARNDDDISEETTYSRASGLRYYVCISAGHRMQYLIVKFTVEGEHRLI